ncbi:hypothetical protein IQ265_08610 [Nodosilinea sp. LEGE 06152]|uniref:hypothetical protein n=1 Tax=Nodosilinea sp. LEGE 06152 TaxID=2777966 RepID=UPI001880DBAE|nr:hypothetical protein [Nodosilinea sp. LEGE 06152]MBE9156889.1 hypothetical protein [Nodosilinea sp. LEGE 06152]
MVQHLAKSPLAWSIGGVGAIAAAAIGLSYLGQSNGQSNPSEPELTLNNFAVSPWQQGTDLGWQAAVAAQTAQTQADWQRVSDLWGQAIAALESVPTDDANYAQAQAKVEEYRGNGAIARDRQAKASPAPNSPAASDLQKALVNAQLAFTFTPGTANRTLGRSVDGLATVELASDRATLVLPRSDGASLTMAQVVYANQFVALAAPGAAAQPWLLDALRAAQRNQSPPIPAGAPVAISAEPETLSITVVTAP